MLFKSTSEKDKFNEMSKFDKLKDAHTNRNKIYAIENLKKMYGEKVWTIDFIMKFGFVDEIQCNDYFEFDDDIWVITYYKKGKPYLKHLSYVASDNSYISNRIIIEKPFSSYNDKSYNFEINDALIQEIKENKIEKE